MKEQLSKYIQYVGENKKHWIFKCPYCGDSKKENHGHLNISKDMPVFRCVRCGQGGHIKALLSHIHANDVIIPEYINDGKFTKKKYKTYKITYNEPLEDYIQEYVKSRLQTDIIPEELNIISTNVLKKVVSNVAEEFGQQPIFNECISFLSYRNRKIISRILNNDKFRYYIYTLSEGSDYYVIKNTRKYTEYKKHNTVVIAEGTFDIANQYIHNFIDIPKDSIYMCASNQSFTYAYKLARSLALSYNPNLIILADQDIESETYNKMCKKYNIKHMKVFKNKLGKDFGEFPVEPYLDLEI